MTEPVLRLSDVHLQRGPRQILMGVSLEIRRAELVAIMGPSGSGKTTILRAIAALEPFHAGRIAIEDVTIDGGIAASRDTMRRLRQKARGVRS